MSVQCTLNTGNHVTPLYFRVLPLHSVLKLCRLKGRTVLCVHRQFNLLSPDCGNWKKADTDTKVWMDDKVQNVVITGSFRKLNKGPCEDTTPKAWENQDSVGRELISGQRTKVPFNDHVHKNLNVSLADLKKKVPFALRSGSNILFLYVLFHLCCFFMQVAMAISLNMMRTLTSFSSQRGVGQ